MTDRQEAQSLNDNDLIGMAKHVAAGLEHIKNEKLPLAPIYARLAAMRDEIKRRELSEA